MICHVGKSVGEMNDFGQRSGTSPAEKAQMMEQMKGELALANAQQLIQVRPSFNFSSPF